MIKGIFPLFVFAIWFSGCSNDAVGPNDPIHSQPEEFFGIGPDIPKRICGTSSLYTLQNKTQDILGEIEILNDPINLYLSIRLEKDWVLNRIGIYNGTPAAFPRHRDQNPNPDNFKFRYNLGQAVSQRNIKIPLSEIQKVDNCIDFAVYAEIGQSDHFGGIYNLVNVWMRGETDGNEFINHHCLRACGTVSQ